MRGRGGWTGAAVLGALLLTGCLGHAQRRRAPAQCTLGPAEVSERLRTTVSWLADDARLGRDTGTDADAESAAWIVRQLTALGLAPAGSDGYAQPFAVVPARPGHPVSTLALPASAPLPDGALRTSNLLARVPGTDPDADTRPVLLVGAHRDHIGRGGPSSRAPGSTAIHNGADDNASGVAALLELARRLQARPAPRTVVFVWFGAEELGLLGSAHLAAHPVEATRALGAMLNMDMVGRLNACRLFVESEGLSPAARAGVAGANAGYGFDARPWEPWRGSWGASDHMSFSRARVPVVFLFTGLHDDYHSPSDDAPTLNYPGLAAVAGYAEATLRALAALPDEALRWQRPSARRSRR